MTEHVQHQGVNDGGKALVRRIQQVCRKSRRFMRGQALDEGGRETGGLLRLAFVTGGSGSIRIFRFAGFRHVFGPHKAALGLQLALMVDGDDGTGYGELVGCPDAFALLDYSDEPFEFVETRTRLQLFIAIVPFVI